MWPNLLRWHKHQFVAQTCVETRQMSSVWQIHYDFLSATLSPKSRGFRSAKMRGAFVSPKAVAVAARAQVAWIIVNNNRKQWIAARKRLLQPEVGSPHDAAFHLTISNSPSRSRGACLRPGFAILASPTRIEGWAERRETFGCRGTRGACHLASKTRVNALMTRHARRLRGALRPMTRDARLSALHRGGFGLRGRACLTGICAGSVTASSSHPGRSAWRAGSRASRGERLRAAAAGRHASLRLQVASGGRPQ